MALNDLMTKMSQDRTLFQTDEASELKVINHVLKLVEDKISEVKNQAVKWYVCRLCCRRSGTDSPDCKTRLNVTFRYPGF